MRKLDILGIEFIIVSIVLGVILTICTGFFQKKNSVYFKRGLIAILSILIFIAVYMYAFRDVFF